MKIHLRQHKAETAETFGTYCYNIYVKTYTTSRLKTIATYIWKQIKLNILNKRLQHASETHATCATSPIYICNIHKKQLQHTFETTETPQTYICNIGERKPGPVNFSRRVGASGERWRTSTSTTSATSTALGLVATPEWGELDRRGEKGHCAGVEGAAHSPVTPSCHLHGSRRRRVDLAPTPWISPGWGRVPPDLRPLGTPGGGERRALERCGQWRIYRVCLVCTGIPCNRTDQIIRTQVKKSPK
jgi:hypothetical protein